MPVQTRSAKKREAAKSESSAAKPLVRDNTIIEITVSATGEGKHIRWIRPSKEPGKPEEVISPDLNNDPRFKTPAPPDPLTSPPRLERRPQRPKTPIRGFPGEKILLNFEKDDVDLILQRACGRDLLNEFTQYLGSTVPLTSDHDLGSPLFNGGRGQDSRWLTSFHSRLQDLQTPSPPDLAEENCPSEDDLEMRQDQESTPRRKPGLGPHGTILLGPDGESLNPEFRERY